MINSDQVLKVTFNAFKKDISSGRSHLDLSQSGHFIFPADESSPVATLTTRGLQNILTQNFRLKISRIMKFFQFIQIIFNQSVEEIEIILCQFNHSAAAASFLLQISEKFSERGLSSF